MNSCPTVFLSQQILVWFMDELTEQFFVTSQKLESILRGQLNGIVAFLSSSTIKWIITAARIKCIFSPNHITTLSDTWYLGTPIMIIIAGY